MDSPLKRLFWSDLQQSVLDRLNASIRNRHAWPDPKL
jgi:hypothetical protein